MRPIVVAVVGLVATFAPSASGSARTATPRCHTGDLRIFTTRFGAAAGTVAGDIAFRNRSGHACFVYGYPGLGLEDAHHRALPSRVTWGSTVARRDPRPHHVTLAPGRAAFSNISFSDVPRGDERCNAPTWLQVTPPDERRHRLVPFGGVCDHGHLTATALSRTRTPHG